MLPKSCIPCRGPGRPRQLDLGEREAIIIDVAERVILSAGLGGASMAAIAREAGMSKRTLYEVFESRAALFAAVVRRIRSSVARPLEPHQFDLPLAERLRLILTPAAEKFTDPLPLALLRAVVAEGDKQPELVHGFLQEGPYALHAMIRLELDRSVARGEIRISDTESAARLMTDMAHESILEHLISNLSECHREEAYRRRLDLAIRVFVGGIGEPEGEADEGRRAS
ncbi:TetR/AcrR family transcriptional regulator [Hoeflea olei]|uniref:HTH tetR-type domain-containing protein n=1 Tax=Hoeflea olei TaxID=1480615 RepID=A0A1C1YXJ0_9HYPH|nr:TetR/AcrR family transcriptional regulator [Hoeflea olei]OCW58149.1 hypothetical protein AWJ14_15995 [Hoeflea olei]